MHSTPVNRSPLPLGARLPPLVAKEIILLGDVPMRTNPYTALVVGVSDRCPQRRSLYP